SARRRLDHELPAQRLLDRRRRFADLLEEVVLEAGAVDVARRDLRALPVLVGELHRDAVVAEEPRLGGALVEEGDLAARERPARPAFGLAIRLVGAPGDLDEGVELGAEDEAALGELAEVDRLAAAAQGEADRARRVRADRGDRGRALERAEGVLESLLERGRP